MSTVAAWRSGNGVGSNLVVSTKLLYAEPASTGMGDRVRVRLPEAALYFGMYPRKQHRVIAEPADSGTCFPTLRVFGG